MDEFNLGGEIIKFVLSIVASLVVAYVTNSKTIEESKFYSYITLAEENFVKKTKRRSNISMSIFLMTYMVIGFNGILYSLPMNKNVSEKAGMIGLIVLILIMLGQYFCTFILAFSDIKYFDEKMRMKRKEISDLDECINLIITIVCVAGVVIILLFRKSVDAVILISYSLILITVGMEAVYYSLISLYVKVRCWYHVEEIIINTKTNKNVYKNIFNYRKNSGVYEFVCDEENVLKRISIPVEEVESIEKNINAGKTYLDIMRQKK